MDRLQRTKFRPSLVEYAVRTALRDAVAWRIGGGSTPHPDAFVAAAVAAARLRLDALDCDSGERSGALSAVHLAARRFSRSALCRRLMRLPTARFFCLRQAGRGADVIVRDRRRRLHAIALTVANDLLAAGKIATQMAAKTPLPAADRLTPLTVHVFSLVTARRYTFEREVVANETDRIGNRVA
jgi:hypothetical protein